MWTDNRGKMSTSKKRTLIDGVEITENGVEITETDSNVESAIEAPAPVESTKKILVKEVKTIVSSLEGDKIAESISRYAINEPQEEEGLFLTSIRNIKLGESITVTIQRDELFSPYTDTEIASLNSSTRLMLGIGKEIPNSENIPAYHCLSIDVSIDDSELPEEYKNKCKIILNPNFPTTPDTEFNVLIESISESIQEIDV